MAKYLGKLASISCSLSSAMAYVTLEQMGLSENDFNPNQINTFSANTNSNVIDLQALNACTNCEKLPENCDLTNNNSPCHAVIWETNADSTHFKLVSNYNEYINSNGRGKYFAAAIANTPWMADGDTYMCTIGGELEQPVLSTAWIQGKRSPTKTDNIQLNRLSNTNFQVDRSNNRHVTLCEFTRQNFNEDVGAFKYSDYNIEEDSSFYLLMSDGNILGGDTLAYHGGGPSNRRATSGKISFWNGMVEEVVDEMSDPDPHSHGDHDHGDHDHGHGTPTETSSTTTSTSTDSDDHGSHDHGSHDHGSHDHGSDMTDDKPSLINSNGQIKLPGNNCLTVGKKSKITVAVCKNNDKKQKFTTKNNERKISPANNNKKCITAGSKLKQKGLKLGKCSDKDINQFEFDSESGHLYLSGDEKWSFAYEFGKNGAVVYLAKRWAINFDEIDESSGLIGAGENHEFFQNRCLSLGKNSKVSLVTCNDKDKKQQFELNESGQILLSQNTNKCITAGSAKKSKALKIDKCQVGDGQVNEFVFEDGHIALKDDSKWSFKYEFWREGAAVYLGKRWEIAFGEE